MAWNFLVNPDSCDNPGHYENFIRLMAIEDQLEGRGTTHILADDSKIYGYVTLRASSLVRTVNGEQHGDPALEIAELAVDKTEERHGIGRILVDFSLAQAGRLNRELLGVRYITLCADPAAEGFYSRVGFRPLADYGEIPREGWNVSCIPMFARLPTGG